MKNLVAKSLAVLSVISSLAACTGVIPTSSDEGRTEHAQSAVTPPCPNAELHSSSSYTECQNGTVVNMEKDIWCCGNNVMRETNTLISSTETVCGGETAAGDAAAPPPACTATPFTNPTVVAGGIVQFNVIPTPANCSVTIDPTSWFPATKWNVVGNGSSSVTVKGSGQPDPGSVSYTWTCTCPKGNGSPGSGADTVTFSS